MIRQLGIPKFFITLSITEIDWIELLIILKKIQTNGEDILSKEEVSKIKRPDRIELLKNDPVTTARFFENRIRNLIAYIFNPKGGTFKDYAVVDYFWRVEFQARGSPHIHMLVWLKIRRNTMFVNMKNTNLIIKKIIKSTNLLISI